MELLTKELLLHGLEQSANGIIILDQEEEVLLWNEQMVRYANISAAEATGRKLTDIFPTIIGNRVYASIRACLSQGVPAFLSQTLNTALFPLFVSGTGKEPSTPMRQQVQIIHLNTDDGKGCCMVQIFDVTAMFKRERYIKTREQEFRALFELAASGNAQLDISDGRLVLVNQKLCEMTGYSNKELRTMHLRDLLPPDVNVPLQTVLERMQHRELQEYSREVSFLHRSGTKYWGYLSMAMGNHSKKIISSKAILVLQDISALKQASEQLQVTQFTLDQVHLAVFWITPEARFAYLNNAACTILGYSRPELLGMSLTDLNSSLTVPLWQELWGRAREKGSTTMESHFTRKNREAFPVEMSINHIRYGDQEFCCLLAGDITDRKQYEWALQEAKEAAETHNRAKSIFLARMSHELRTPLNAVLGFSEIMRNTPGRSAEDKSNLKTIHRSGSHLLQLINDVLDMSKIEAGHLRLEVNDFDFSLLINDVVDMIQLRAVSTGLTLTLEQSPQVPRYIRGDGGKIRQILINLLSNAVKFTEEGGVILRLDADHSTPGQVMLLGEVEDSGPGIQPENINRIFMPFEQLAEKSNQEGTGLGLAITREFIKLMGGEIRAESEPGRGSVFRFHFLVGPQQDEFAIQPKSIAGQVTGLVPGQPEYRILIAEDNPDNLAVLQKLLKDVGFTVRAAKNGAEAVQYFQDWSPCFIWMDRQMPIMDGLTATRKIRELPGGREVKIVALTASVFKEQREEILKGGADDFVGKPYVPSEIFECMSTHLDLRFQYLEQEEEVKKAAIDITALEQLPVDLLQKLHKAFVLLDRDLALDEIEVVAAIDPVLAENLAGYVDNMEFDQPSKAIARVRNKMQG